MNKEEIWKAIAGYEDYKISSLGRVKSLGNNKLRKEKILKPQKDGDGYLFVHLWRNGKGKMFKIHRLVASAFIPNPLGFNEINHKDEDKINNCVENLEWASRWYNMHYGTIQERISKVVEASRFSDFREICFRFASTQEAGRNGYGYSAVAACCRGCYSTHRGNFYKGLFWRYAS